MRCIITNIRQWVAQDGQIFTRNFAPVDKCSSYSQFVSESSIANVRKHHMIAGRWHLKCQTDTYSPTEGSRIEDDILPDFRAPKSHILLNKTAANCLPGRDTAITKPHRTTSALHVSIAKYWSKSLACHSAMCIGFSSGRCSDGSNRFCSVSLTSPVRAELIVTHDCCIETYITWCS